MRLRRIEKRVEGWVSDSQNPCRLAEKRSEAKRPK
jgi:hypothetical protein